MPAQFDHLADVEAHRQVGSTLDHAAGAVSGGRAGTRSVLMVGAGFVALAALAALAAPSALAGSTDGTVLTASAAAPHASASKHTSSAAASSAPQSASSDTASDSAVPVSSSATKPKPAPTANAAPIPATETAYARNIPAYPRDGRHGRRIVYDKALMVVYLVDSHDKVVRRYPVTGRWDRPKKGVYHVYSMSADTMNAHSMVTFNWMVRFAWGTNVTSASIGFHSIPIFYQDNPARDAKKGDRMSKLTDLGLPVATGGCVRQSDADAKFLYRWAEVGDTVVVLPTAG